MPQITIQGLQFEVADRFAEGHTLKANEASSLNQTLRENIRNNLATKIDKAKTEGKSASEMQEMVDEYAATYEFGVHVGGGRVSDPIERELLDIAETKVKDAIKSAGKKIKDFSKEQFDDLVAKAIERNPAWREAAEATVAARARAVTEVGDLLA